MPNPELELISNVIKTGNFAQLKKKAITPEFFRSEEAQVVFRWLWDTFHDPKHRGEVPTQERLVRKFPDFDFCPSRNSVPALIAELQEDRLSMDIEVLSAEMQGLLGEGEDPRLVLEAYMPKFRDLNTRTADHNGVFMRDAYGLLRQEYDTVNDAGGITGIPWPWEPLNRATRGLHSEEWIVIYGRPKNMKTFCALVVACCAYMSNYRVFFYSRENSQINLIRRAASIISGVDYARVQEARLSEAEEDAYFGELKELSEWEDDWQGRGDSRKPALYFDSDKGRRQASSVDDLVARAERFEPDLVVADGFYLMRDGRTKSRTADWRNIAHISQDLKGAAQYLECPVLGTSQANRTNAKTPTGDLDDLSYADAIGQDADLAIRIFKGPHPTGHYKYSIALTFPGLREADLKPFLINAAPGHDFSLLQKNVDLKAFLKSKNAMEASEVAKAEVKAKRGKSPFRQ